MKGDNLRIGFAIDKVLTIVPDSHRLYLHIKGEKYQQETQLRGIPNEPIIKLLRILKEIGHEIFLISSRYGMPSFERTLVWLNEQNLGFLAKWKHLYLNFLGVDPADLQLALEHKIKYIDMLKLDLYIEGDRGMAEELRKQTDTIIVHYRR